MDLKKELSKLEGKEKKIENKATKVFKMFLENPLYNMYILTENKLSLDQNDVEKIANNIVEELDSLEHKLGIKALKGLVVLSLYSLHNATSNILEGLPSNTLIGYISKKLEEGLDELAKRSEVDVATSIYLKALRLLSKWYQMPTPSEKVDKS